MINTMARWLRSLAATQMRAVLVFVLFAVPGPAIAEDPPCLLYTSDAADE